MQAPILIPTTSGEFIEEDISFEDYLRKYDSYEGGRTEWLAGKVAFYPLSNNVQHNELLRFLITLLSAFLELKTLGQIALAGVPMKVGEDKPAREPDIMVILTPHLDRVRATHIDGIADVVVEIVSPESDARDYADKLTEYEAAGVPEYWLIDPQRQQAVIHVLDADLRYRRAPLDGQGRLVSTVLPGFALAPAQLWQDTYPGSITIVRLAEAMG